MTTIAAVEAIISGEAGSLKASIAEAVGLVGRFKNDAERSAAAIEKAFAQQEKSVERLRKSLDPLYASSKRYEGAVEQLDKALRHGIISQAEHARMLDLSGKAYLGAQQQTVAATGAMSRLANMSGSTKAAIQNVGYQVQDMAVQLAGGTAASTVFAQQGSQIASVFGPVGAVIGTLAAVGIPLLAAAFFKAEEEARSFKDVLSDLQAQTQALSETQAILKMSVVKLVSKYGVYAGAVREAATALAELQIAEAKADLAAAVTAASDALDQFAGKANSAFSSGITTAQAILNIRDVLGVTSEQAQMLANAFDAVKRASSFNEQVLALRNLDALLKQAGVSSEKLPSELRNALIEARQATIAMAELRDTANDAAAAVAAIIANAPVPGWLSGAIADASTLAGKLWDAAAAAAEAAGGQADATGGDFPVGSRGRSRPRRAPNGIGGVDWGAAPGSGGVGGGGGANPVIGQLEQVRQSLLTQEQLQMESYLRQQETLRAALEQRLITQQEYTALMEQTQTKHQDAMAQIDAYRYGSGLQMTQAFMGDMASALSTGGEKMVKVSRIFGAAQALISTYVGAAKALELPFPANIAAAAKVMAAGMGFVSAIKSGSGAASASSRGVASTAATAAPAAAAAPAGTASITIRGDVIGRQTGAELVREINSALKAGYKLNLDWV